MAAATANFFRGNLFWRQSGTCPSARGHSTLPPKKRYYRLIRYTFDIYCITTVVPFSGQGWEYLSFRMWIGVWVGLILLILVATDASAFVCYITRFTEENFATLIAVIFIIKALQKLVHIQDTMPIHDTPCFCNPYNDTSGWHHNLSLEYSKTGRPMMEGHHGSAVECSFSMPPPSANSSTSAFVDVVGYESVGCHYVPNGFLMSCLLFIGTFLISYHLKAFKTQSFFPAMVRNYISDFAVVIAIVSMTTTDLLVGVDTPKLSVPDKFAPTRADRGWVVPILNGNPW